MYLILSICFAFFGSNRYRLNSTSDEDDDDEYPIYQDYNEHMQYRERLQEFPGRIPQRKKKDTAEITAPPRKSRVSPPHRSQIFFRLLLNDFNSVLKI